MNTARSVYPTLSTEQIRNYTSRRQDIPTMSDNIEVTRRVDQATGDTILTAMSNGSAYHHRITHSELSRLQPGIETEVVFRAAEQELRNRMHNYNHQTMVRRINNDEYVTSQWGHNAWQVNNNSIGHTVHYTNNVTVEEWTKLINRLEELEAEVLKLKTGEVKLKVENMEL